MYLLRFTIVGLFLAAGTGLKAQGTDSLALKDTVAKPERTHLLIGVSCNSGLNYYGRVDSLHSKAFYPFVGVALKNGLYANANFVFIHNSLQSQYAATLLEGGYNFKDAKGHWAGNLAISRFFYEQDINLIQAAVKEMFAASLTHLNKIVNVTIGGNLKWSDKADFGAQAGLDHIIRIPHIFGKDVIVLDPTASVYAGTQNFTEVYYQQRNFLVFPVADQQVTTSGERFSILAYECSLPLVYGYKQFNFILTPSYILPQNLVVVPGRPDLSENGGNLLYVTAAVRFSF